MKSGGAAKESVGKRMTHELKEFIIITVYLYVCFAAIIYLKAAILHAHGIAFAPFSIAVVKAAICAKFMLIGNALHIGGRYKTQALIWPTLHRSFAFLVLLLVLNILEEIIVGAIHHRGITDSILDVAGGTLNQLIASSVVVLLILIPYFAFRSLGEVVGEQNLVRVFLEPRRKADNA
jgi:hypothetical protein